MHFGVIKPEFIDQIDHSKMNKWIYNFLEETKENVRIVHDHALFKLIKGWEFNDGDLETLYCLAVPKQRDLMTIRDLKKEHLPLLKSMREESLEAIEKKYGIKRCNIRAFFHYLPTYYHLHIHFVHVKMVQTVSCHVGRAILLDDVIDNIELYSPNQDIGDYYQKKTIVQEIKGGT